MCWIRRLKESPDVLSLWNYTRTAFIVSVITFYIHLVILKLLKSVLTAHLLVLILLVYSGAFG